MIVCCKRKKIEEKFIKNFLCKNTLWEWRCLSHLRMNVPASLDIRGSETFQHTTNPIFRTLGTRNHIVHSEVDNSVDYFMFYTHSGTIMCTITESLAIRDD